MARFSPIVLLSAATAACSIQSAPIDPDYPEPELDRVTTQAVGFESGTIGTSSDTRQPAPRTRPAQASYEPGSASPSPSPREEPSEQRERASFAPRRIWVSKLKGFDEVAEVQKDPDWCWAACAKMLLAYDGIRTTQQRIVQQILGETSERQTGGQYEILLALYPELGDAIAEAIAANVLVVANSPSASTHNEGEGKVELEVDPRAALEALKRMIKGDPIPNALYDLAHGYPSIVGIMEEGDVGHVWILVGARYSVPVTVQFWFDGNETKEKVAEMANDDDLPEGLRDLLNDANDLFQDGEHGDDVSALLDVFSQELTLSQYQPLLLELYDPFTGEIEDFDPAKGPGRVTFTASRPSARRYFLALTELLELRRDR